MFLDKLKKNFFVLVVKNAIGNLTERLPWAV